jgi:hypothetical protein
MITERAMLAAIHISIWTAVKHDRKVSHEVASQHGAPVNAGRYNKQLLRGAGRLDDLRTLAGQIRQHFYKITLPWSDEGYRLLPAHFYFDLTARMREYEQSFSKQVEDFLDFYPSYIEHVRPLPRGGLSLCGRAAQEVRSEAGGAAYPQRRRLPRHHVG